MTFNLPDLARISLDEIIFEGRNQAYGAFDLRRSYDQHLKRAVGLTMGLCLLLIGAPLAWQALATEKARPRTVPLFNPDKGKVVLSDLPPIPQPSVKHKNVSHPKINTTAFLTRRVVADHTIVTETPEVTQASLLNATVGTTTVTDGEEGPTLPLETFNAGSDGTASEELPTTQTWEYVEQMPEFEGGMQALMQFLGKNIKYPPMALRNQVEGKIFLKFVVNERGEVDNPTVLKGLGAGLDEEATRVVKLLRFKPGMQNGRAVKVYFSLPISFQIR